jgi:hypothetical protein
MEIYVWDFDLNELLWNFILEVLALTKCRGILYILQI